MTPFMARIAELIGVEIEGGEHGPLTYRTRPSTDMTASVGADRHVAIRALCEQLVCEANAVLAATDDHLALVDDVGEGELAFTVYYRNRMVRVSTFFEDGIAYGRLMGDGVPPGPTRELEEPQAVADLLLLLIAEAGLPQHPVSP